MHPRKAVIQQVDLDTACTAWLLRVTPRTPVEAVVQRASEDDLADPEVLCIECGGSGEVARGNFDHHDTDRALPPACRQALAVGPWREDPRARRLVDYVAAIDLRDKVTLGTPPPFPSLSQVFSGMRLTVADPVAQLRAGIAILDAVVHEGWDPFGTLPQRPEWAPWLAAVRREEERLAEALAGARYFTTRGGLKAGYVESEAVGALSALYAQGCRVAIACHPRFGPRRVRKYTIGGDGIRVDGLLPRLNALEPGWGGPAHGTVIGSPRVGSRLKQGVVSGLVREGF